MDRSLYTSGGKICGFCFGGLKRPFEDGGEVKRSRGKVTRIWNLSSGDKLGNVDKEPRKEGGVEEVMQGHGSIGFLSLANTLLTHRVFPVSHVHTVFSPQFNLHESGFKASVRRRLF